MKPSRRHSNRHNLALLNWLGKDKSAWRDSVQPKVPVEKPNWQLIAAFIQRVGVQLASAVSYMVPDVLTVNDRHGFFVGFFFSEIKQRNPELFDKLKAGMFLKL